MESGQLKRSPKYEAKIAELIEKFDIQTFKDIIQECKPQWGETKVTEQIKDKNPGKSAVSVKQPEPQRKTSENMTLEEQLHFDPDVEYDRIIEAEGEKMNGRDRKNLKKKLKAK